MPLLARFREDVRHCHGQATALASLLDTILGELDRTELLPDDHLSSRLFFEVLHDLARQGWSFTCHDTTLHALPPETVDGGGHDQREIKVRLRASLLAARNDQLQTESVSQFVRDLERPRRHGGRYVSVLNLLLAPHDLKADLKRRLTAPVAIRDELLCNIIQPYLQRATEERDTFTNLRLIDIWRYCRYTWSLPLSSQPGRQLFYLVRDAARPFHPIIGIGALGSSVVQITSRDEAIGWSLRTLRDAADRDERMQALQAELDRTVSEIRWDDLLHPDEVAQPTQAVLDHLVGIIAEEQPVARTETWARSLSLAEATSSPMYRRKRATELLRLLRARRAFQAVASETHDCAEQMSRLLEHEEGRIALRTALRSIKKRHIGCSMMDITTCGALPPYSDLLGGKLVSLLMASPQVIADYRARYAGAMSEIASRMKGAAVVRPAELVLLSTTSLYYVGSSQYNRLSAPAARGQLRYVSVGHTEGFGSLHLSQRTYQTLQRLLRTHAGLRPQSYVFAAGVNYKMRAISAGLAHVGLDKLQAHKSRRLVYLVPLAANWREYLGGRTTKPAYLYADLEHPEPETAKLIEFWKDRWFLPRLQRAETLQRLGAATDTIRVSRFLNDAHAFGGDDRAGRDSRPLDVAAKRGVGLNSHPMLSWQTFAQLKDQRASFAERLAPEELAALHIPSRLDTGLVDMVRAGRRIYLTGNPGDGKTHVIRRYEAQLETLQAFVNLDASAEDETTLLAGLNLAIANGRPAVIAINEGPLRRLLPRLPAAERSLLQPQLDEPYIYRREQTPERAAVVVNLGLRQVLAHRMLEGVFELVLNRVDYTDAPAAVRRNHAMLARPRVRERLQRLLELVSRSGAHLTMHQLLGFFAYIVTEGEADPERAVGTRPYFELLWADANPLIHWLRPLDPAVIPHPMVDMCLWDGDGGKTIEWLEPPDEDAPLLEEDPSLGRARFQRLKRRYFFETSHGDQLLEMLPEDRATFYQLLQESQAARDTAKQRLLEVFAHFFGDANTDGPANQLRIWTSLRYDALAPSSSFMSSQTISADKVDLLVPRLPADVATLLDFAPAHLRLRTVPPTPQNSAVGLDIDLELWLALMKIKRGMPQRYHDPVIGRRLNQFMSRLAVEHREQHLGYAQLLVRDIAAGQTYEVDVSLEKRKYRV